MTENTFAQCYFWAHKQLATARARSFNNANALTISDVCQLFLHDKQASESPAQPQKRINPTYRRLEKNKKYTSPIAQKPLQIRHWSGKQSKPISREFPAQHSGSVSPTIHANTQEHRFIISTKRQNLRYKQYSSAPINTIRCHKYPRARRVQNCFKSMHPGFKFSLRQAEFSSKFQVILFCLTQNSCLSAGQKRYGAVRYTLSQQAQIDGFSAKNQNQLLHEIRTAAVIYPVFISF